MVILSHGDGFALLTVSGRASNKRYSTRFYCLYRVAPRTWEETHSETLLLSRESHTTTSYGDLKPPSDGVETHTQPPKSRGPEPEAAHAADPLVVDADVLVEEVLVERADALALPVARRGLAVDGRDEAGRGDVSNSNRLREFQSTTQQ